MERLKGYLSIFLEAIFLRSNYDYSFTLYSVLTYKLKILASFLRPTKTYGFRRPPTCPKLLIKSHEPSS